MAHHYDDYAYQDEPDINASRNLPYKDWDKSRRR
jgi:hypothetical protein